MCTHSCKYAFFKVSPIGIQYERIDPLCGLSLASCYQVLVWHHCRQVFPSCSATQLRPLLFFLPGCTFLVATSIACCLCHLVRVTSTFAVGKVAKFVIRQLLQLSPCSITHCGLPPKEDDLLFTLPRYLQTCHLFRDSRFLGLTLRPSAPVFRCHRVSWACGRLAFAQEAVRVSPFSFFSIFLFLLTFARSFRKPSSKFSSSGVEM